MSEANCPRLPFALVRRHSGQGRDHDAGRDQRILADHVGWHSDGVAGDQAHQQRSRHGSGCAENQVDCLILAHCGAFYKRDSPSVCRVTPRLLKCHLNNPEGATPVGDQGCLHKLTWSVWACGLLHRPQTPLLGRDANLQQQVGRCGEGNYPVAHAGGWTNGHGTKRCSEVKGIAANLSPSYPPPSAMGCYCRATVIEYFLTPH
jgi:hypothetical protein